jgi:hypothetical protein
VVRVQTINDASVTKTRYGMTTTHFLLSTSQDGVLMLDKRLIDPRRPTKEPTEPEKAEGLMQYSQVLPLRHTWFISYNTTIHGLRLVSSAPSTFESTTLISAVGKLP